MLRYSSNGPSALRPSLSRPSAGDPGSLHSFGDGGAGAGSVLGPGLLGLQEATRGGQTHDFRQLPPGCASVPPRMGRARVAVSPSPHSRGRLGTVGPTLLSGETKAKGLAEWGTLPRVVGW